MKSLTRHVLLFAFSLSFFSAHTLAQDATGESELSESEKAKIIADTVALGREYMGGAAKLDAINSLRFDAVLVYSGGLSGTVETVMKKPNNYQVVSTIGGLREISTLNPTAAWQKTENFKEPGVYTMRFYEVEEMRNLEAMVSSIMSFLKTPPTRNGRIEYVGTGSVLGKKAIVLNYVHSDRIWFRRFFDPETGRLMHMVSSNGVVFTYEGELESDGVVFPQKTLVRYLTQFGEQTMEISYTSATVNPDLNLERFAVPQVGE